eukprot:jgi/Mesen1/4091/ME000214S03271
MVRGSRKMPSSEQLAAYNAYKFTDDARWQAYKLNLTIPPDRGNEAAIIERYKQKYYKQNVDPSFDIGPLNNSASTSAGNGTQTQHRAPPVSRGQANARPQPQPGFAHADVAGARGQYGLDAQTIMFLAHAWVLLMSSLAVFPFTPSSLLARAFRFSLLGSAAAAIVHIVNTNQNRTMLITLAASLEVSLGFVLFLYVFTPQRSLLQVLLYWQLLKLKYHAPSSAWAHRQAWTQVGARFEPLLQRYTPFLLTPLNYAKRWFLSVG